MKTKTVLMALLVAALGLSFWRWGVPALQRGSPPSLKQAEAAFCKEHGVPETECAICHPELASASGSRGEQIGSRSPEEKDVIEVEKNGEEAVCEKANAKIKFQSPEVAKAAGIMTVEVGSQPISETVQANGKVVFDGVRTVHLSSRIPGVIREIRKDLGQDVEAGEVLFVVDSVELGETQAGYLEALAEAELAHKNVERERLLAEKSATSQRDLLEAEARDSAAGARLSRSEDRLRNLGLSAGEIDRLRKERKVSSMLPVTAPFSGTVVEREAVAGEMTDPSRPIMTLTDLSKVWVLLDLFEKDLAKVEVGQKAVFTADAYPDRPFRGAITWISARIDPETRTLPVRMEVKNAKHMLKENLFGRAAIFVREESGALVVPKEAVQWEGCHHVVFVPLQEGHYQTKQVQLGYSGDRFYEVTAGLLPGERVVTTGSFLLKTEILKGSIGAG